MLRIDVHVHYSRDHVDCVGLLDRLDVKLFNVCVAHGADDPWRALAHVYRQLTVEQLYYANAAEWYPGVL